MSAAATQFTLADLERMPDDGMHRELLHGVLIELPPPKLKHSVIANRIAPSLSLSVAKAPHWTVLIEAGYQLSEDRVHWLQPDVSLVETERVQQTAEDAYLIGAPAIAVEIISPSESAGDVLDKTEAYLRAGAKAVVNIYPKQRLITIHRPDTTLTLRDQDILSLPDLIPGWQMSLAECFS